VVPVVIGVGLTNDTLSPEPRHLASRRSVGKNEIARLLGTGKAAGQGPLARFLAAIGEAGDEAHLLLVSHGAKASEGDEREGGLLALAAPLAASCDRAARVETGPGQLPLRRIVAGLAEAAGASAEALERGEVAPRVLIVGCDTDKRVAAIATFLHTMLGLPEVAVSAHLVGSTTPAAHFAALRHNLPAAGVRVFLDLQDAAEFVGLDAAPFAGLGLRPCQIGPSEVGGEMSAEQRRIIQALCLHWSRADVRPLQGGFSGSLLLLADGWKGEARTEPAVLKIDRFDQMRRELEGYYLVKDFFGKHVPTFGLPVVEGESIGVAMELAAMEGRPETLQDGFEEAEGEEALAHFMRRLEKSLALLAERLYGNTRENSWVAPYRAFWLHTHQQVEWFEQNAGFILGYMEELGHAEPTVRVDQLARVLKLVAANEDGLRSDTCVAHGDLNLANVICDQGDNVWFIDWTHSGRCPLELDFAKLESDVKFVISKQFEAEDVSRLRKLEEYLLSTRLPAGPDNLPDSLRFAKWDLRFRKILLAVRTIRQACFSLKADDDWLVYRVALLRYALHTLSFDVRRGRGECEPQQLMHALISVEGLLYDLVADDFHLKIRAERPSSYPQRLRLSIDEAPWILECPDYDPPYHVDPLVVESAGEPEAARWADPEDFALVAESRAGASKYHDELGRPLNPRGRTGLAGRGRLGRWGANPSVMGVVTRRLKGEAVELLLGRKPKRETFALPKGFVLPQESPGETLARVLEAKFGFAPDAKPDTVFEGQLYDRRQTDHAWVEAEGLLVHVGSSPLQAANASAEFDEVGWHPLTAETVNRLPSGHARIARAAVERLRELGILSAEDAGALLARTG
jgi:ADP-ribose pyrophosphatase